MKKSFLIYIICLSTFSLKAQNFILTSYYSKLNNNQQINNQEISNQQKDILNKEKVKKVRTSFYKIGFVEEKVSDKIIFFDSIGNIQKRIFESSNDKIIESYAYNEFNNLKSKKATAWLYKNAQGDFTHNKYPTERYYNYDDKNRLIEKKTCEDGNVCKIEKIKYFGNKVYTYYQDIHGEIEKIEVVERKDSIEQKLELNKNNEILQKSISFYSKDSLKLKEDCFKNDTLIYSEVNEIENNKIIQSIKSTYFKKRDTNKIHQLVDGTYFVYNSDHSIKTIKSVGTNAFNNELHIRRYEYVYNEKGLLIEKHRYSKDKLHFTTLYEYEMW